MKAFINPLLFITCILLLAFGYVSSAAGEEGATAVETWVLTLCLLGTIINGTLGVARAMTQRPAVACIGWAVAFLISGSVVWALVSGEGMESVSSQERTLLRQRVDGWKSGQKDPWLPDENGDCVLSLAAGLGKVDIVRELSQPAVKEERAMLFVQAAHRAAERNREQVLRELIPAMLPVDSRLSADAGEPTPLHTATMNKAHRAAVCLLELGADANAAMADGSTSLHHAVLADDAAMVRLLLRHGADPKRLDADGRDAASYARTEAVSEALEAALSPASPAAGN